ncbi:MAG: L-threonylcarbamoyladenylate synthase [Oscillospiraceae bacterium]
METEVIKIEEGKLDSAVAKAASLLKAGKIVAIPTETVYGLAASIYEEKAINEIYEVKGRPQDNPIIVHISNLMMLGQLAAEIPQSAEELAKEFWPGPLTMVLKKTENVSDTITCGLDSVAIRMPSHPVARAVIDKAGVPLAAPSANLSGKPSTTTAAHVLADLDGLIPLILDAGACDVGIESTVVSLTGEHPLILRPGIISLEDIRRVLPDAEVCDSAFQKVDESAKVPSPGMKYKHYSPIADVVIVQGSLENFIKYTSENARTGEYAMCFDGEENAIKIPSISYGAADDPEVQAHRIFSILRTLDMISTKRVFVRAPEHTGKAMGVYNRLIRAAGFKVVKL